MATTAAHQPEDTLDWARRIRELTLRASFTAHVGHVGSCLSVAELLAVIYRDLLRGDAPDSPDRDRFILGKGHAALALFAALHLRGWLAKDQLDTFFCNGTLLGVHPDAALPGIDFSTGSLGMGLGFGVGAALAARMEGSDRRCFVVMSDGECNEGSVWESAHVAGHHRLGNLIAIIDDNGQQAFGYTKDVLNLGALDERFAAIGWDTATVDGHDETAIKQAVESHAGERPLLLLAKTVFGRGVDYMENKIEWHYLPMDQAQFADALAQIGVANGADA